MKRNKNEMKRNNSVTDTGTPAKRLGEGNKFV